MISYIICECDATVNNTISSEFKRVEVFGLISVFTALQHILGNFGRGPLT